MPYNFNLKDPSKVKDAQSQNGATAKPKTVDGSVVSELVSSHWSIYPKKRLYRIAKVSMLCRKYYCTSTYVYESPSYCNTVTVFGSHKLWIFSVITETVKPDYFKKEKCQYRYSKLNGKFWCENIKGIPERYF